jgi:Tol biopolymer transport system component
VNSGDLYGVFLINSDGKNPRQLSNLGYETIAGWSPEGSILYYAIPGSTGDGFLLRSVDVSTGNTKDLFVLENSSLKAPMPAVSPDGKWIAYRASENSSLFIKGMDGSPARLLLDDPANAINGIAWDKESFLLGVSLITPEYPDGEIILIAPDTCETYLLPGLSGELDGVFIP